MQPRKNDLSEEVSDFLDRAIVPLRIATTNKDGWPLMASLWFLRDGNDLWCATPVTAKLVERLRDDPRCTIEVSSNLAPYQGVRLRCDVELDPTHGTGVLERLIDRYLGDRKSRLARWLLDREVPEMAIRLSPRSATAWDFRARMRDTAPFHA